MGTRFYKFLIVLAGLFFGQNVSGQVIYQKTGFKKPVFSFTSDSLSSSGPGRLFSMRPDNYVKNFAFFCRQEWKIEKSTGIPLRFRIGSLDQCNYLEGYPSAHMINR